MHPELLGTPLPDTPILWLALLVSIATALVAMLSVVERFLELFYVHTAILRRYGGLALPVSWAIWSILLLYWRFETLTVLVVLLGTLCIAIVTTALFRRSQGPR